jgi:hypothetical protein
LQGFLSAEGLRQVFVSLACCQILKPNLAAGFLGGRFRRLDELAPDDWRRSNPRFQGEQIKMNLAIADRFYARSQTEKQCTPAQLALAWLLRVHSDVIPIAGTSSMERLEENARATDLVLSDQDLARLEAALPKGAVVGERYAPAMMKIVNGWGDVGPPVKQRNSSLARRIIETELFFGEN